MTVRVFLYQSIFNIAFAVPSAITAHGWEHQQPVVIKKPVNVAKHQFSGYVPQPITSAADTFQVAGFTDGGVVAWQNVSYQSIFNVPGPPFSDFDKSFSESPPRFAKPFPAKLQRFPDFAPAGTILTTPDAQGWWGQSPALFRKPFPVNLQRFGDFQPQDTIVSVTPQGWWTPSPALFAKAYPAKLQRFQDFVPQGNLFSTAQGWWGQSPERFAKPFPAKLQRFPDFQPAGGIAAFEVVYGWWGQSPAVFRKPYPVVLQRFPDFVPFGTPAIVANNPMGAYAQIFERFKRPVHPKLMPFSGFQPRGTIVSITPQGFWTPSPVLFRKRFPVTLQQFSALSLRAFFISTPPEGVALKNEVIRTTWLANEGGRQTFLKNEIQRMGMLTAQKVRVTWLKNEVITTRNL